jgi:F0F1-type ATP synthase assembly protein I
LNGFASRIRPFRIVLRWQLVATAVLTLVSAIPWGGDGAISAALGGAVNIVAGGVYGWRVTRGDARTAGDALATMFRAWGIKVLLIVVQLMLVLSLYRDIVHAAFFAAFVVTVGVFAAAVAVSEPGEKQDPPLI